MIIKCPECGHQVSDKAPVCPSCGVEIAGHLVKCSYCGEIYLKEDVVCPNCHRSGSTNSNENEDDIKENVVAEETKNNEQEFQEESLPTELVVSAEPVVEAPRPNSVQETLTEEPLSKEKGIPADGNVVRPEVRNSHTPLFISLLIALAKILRP